MQITKAGWKNSIFTRLIFTFLLIILPLYFLGIQIFNWSKGMMTREIFSSMQSQVVFYLNNWDNDIKRIKKLQFDCFSDDDLNSLAHAERLMDTYTRTKAILRLQQRLTSIRDSSTYLQDVCVHIPSIDLTIHASGTNKGSIQEFDREAAERVKKYPKASEASPIFTDNRLLLIAVPPFWDGSKTLPAFFIEAELSGNAIKGALVRPEEKTGVRSILEMPGQGFSISSDSNSKTTGQLLQIINRYAERNKSDAISVEVENQRFLLNYVYSDYSNTMISRYIPEDIVLEPLQKYRLWYWAFSLLAVCIIILYSFSTYRFIQRPLAGLVKLFKKVQKGEFEIQLQSQGKNEFGYLYSAFSEMVSNLKILIDQVYKQKILMQKAELKQLQSQINPHFLYNSFFILQRRIKRGDYENADKFCESLGVYFLFITRSASDEVALEKEVEHARIYTEIQASRFNNRITADFGELPEDCRNIRVPRLIIQPIIENAFEHGLEDMDEGGTLVVRFTPVEGRLVISVEDNGKCLDDFDLDRLKKYLANELESQENTGIINIHKRIRIALGNRSGIEVSRSGLGGLKVEIFLSLEEQPCTEC